MFENQHNIMLRELLQGKAKQLERRVDHISNLYMLVFRTGEVRLSLKYICPKTKKRVRIGMGNPLLQPYYQVLTAVDEMKQKLMNDAPIIKDKAQTVTQYFEQKYMPWACANKASHRDDKSRFKARIKAAIGETKMTNVTTDMLQSFIDAQVDLKPASKNRYIALLKKALSLAVDWKYIEKNPAEPIRLLRENNCGQRRILSKAELVKLGNALDACGNPSIAVLVRLLMTTGARLKELMTLKVADIDFEQRLVKLTRTKSGKVRFLALSDYAFALVCKQVTDQSVYLFPSKRNPNAPMVNPYKTLDRIRQHMGISNWTFHGCRAQFASMAANAGGSVFEISKALGHADIKTTLERYSFIQSETVRRVSELVSKQLT